MGLDWLGGALAGIAGGAGEYGRLQEEQRKERVSEKRLAADDMRQRSLAKYNVDLKHQYSGSNLVDDSGRELTLQEAQAAEASGEGGALRSKTDLATEATEKARKQKQEDALELEATRSKSRKEVAEIQAETSRKNAEERAAAYKQSAEDKAKADEAKRSAKIRDKAVKAAEKLKKEAAKQQNKDVADFTSRVADKVELEGGSDGYDAAAFTMVARENPELMAVVEQLPEKNVPTLQKKATKYMKYGKYLASESKKGTWDKTAIKQLKKKFSLKDKDVDDTLDFLESIGRITQQDGMVSRLKPGRYKFTNK